MKHVIVVTIVALSATFAWAQESKTPPPKPATPVAPAAPAKPDAPAAPATAGPVYVLFKFDRGDVVLELDPVKAPITVANFMEYVKNGFYDNTMIHRALPEFVIQGGGYDTTFTAKPTRPSIKNEWQNGLKNRRGTISMARRPDPNSATSQFFLNVKDNPDLDGAQSAGYAVFGHVLRGMDVVDGIAISKTSDKVATEQTGRPMRMMDVPVDSVVILKAQEITAEEAKSVSGGKSATPTKPDAPKTEPPPGDKPSTPPSAPPAAPSATAPGSAASGSTAEAAVRGLMLGSVMADEAAVKAVIMPHPDSAILWSGPVPTKDQLVLVQQRMGTVTFRECKAGDTLVLGGGRKFTVTPDMVGPDAKVLVPDMGAQGTSMPMVVKRIDGTWRVDATPVIEARMLANQIRESMSKGANPASSKPAETAPPKTTP